MKNYLLYAAMFCFAVNLCAQSSTDDYHVNTIVIDPGHGGTDPGCKGAKYNEKDIALDIALRLGKHIHENNPNVKIVFTRTKDESVPLFQRIRKANAIRADLFVSIHCNSSSNKEVKGSETFVMGLHRAEDNLEVAQRENSVILLENDYEENYEGFDPDSPVGHIVLTSFQDAYLGQSLAIAEKVETELKTQGYSTSRGVKQAGFAVLRRATMPSILIETGFLTNKEEEKYLGSEEGQIKVSHSIYRAISSFLNAKISANTHNEKKSATYEVLSSSTTQSLNQYSVQFAAMKNEIDVTENEKLSQIGRVGMVKMNGYFKYRIMNIDSKADALSIKKQLASLGYKGAFIISSKS